MRGCYVRANPLGPLLLEAGGPAAMTADYSSWRRRLLQCRLFVVRFDQRCGVRADRGSTCAVHTAGDMHHPPPGSSACLVLRIHSAGARSARQTARTAWHAPRGAVGKLFDGVISYSAHTVITLSARSHPQCQPWLGWGLSDRMPSLTFIRSLGSKPVMRWWGVEGFPPSRRSPATPRRAARARRSSAISHSIWSAPRPERRAGTPAAPQLQ